MGSGTNKTFGKKNPTSQDSWTYLRKIASDKMFLSNTPLTHDAFVKPLKEFKRQYQSVAEPGRRGQPPRILSAHELLGCLLI